MAKVKVVVEKLSLPEVRVAIMDMWALSGQIDKLEKDKKALQAKVVATLGLTGVLEFANSSLNFRAKVVQAFRRTVPWREIAVAFAKELYNKTELAKWGRQLVRKYPKKPTSAWVKLTVNPLES